MMTGALLAVIFIASTASSSTAAPPPDTARFAIIGDYGMNNQAELDMKASRASMLCTAMSLGGASARR
jgi:hypothetical protein